MNVKQPNNGLKSVNLDSNTIIICKSHNSCRCYKWTLNHNISWRILKSLTPHIGLVNLMNLCTVLYPYFRKNTSKTKFSRNDFWSFVILGYIRQFKAPNVWVTTLKQYSGATHMRNASTSYCECYVLWKDIICYSDLVLFECVRTITKTNVYY